MLTQLADLQRVAGKSGTYILYMSISPKPYISFIKFRVHVICALVLLSQYRSIKFPSTVNLLNPGINVQKNKPITCVKCIYVVHFSCATLYTAAAVEDKKQFFGAPCTVQLL